MVDTADIERFNLKYAMANKFSAFCNSLFPVIMGFAFIWIAYLGIQLDLASGFGSGVIWSSIALTCLLLLTALVPLFLIVKHAFSNIMSQYPSLPFYYFLGKGLFLIGTNGDVLHDEEIQAKGKLFVNALLLLMFFLVIKYTMIA